ncbi:MAG: hypothetical protein A2902_05465 [Elusimicrobia bacterium RIFCSPLOWO2_01_FULL_64_13]|nr:MAG: hypothetical protein A2902_05465 [Elusimicrobia bacterium RIFCSPLOWO2_01_FULL_64_13]
MGSGKTTVGKVLARKLGWRFVDTDRVIEKKEGRSIAAIFATRGEKFFRTAETRAIRAAVRSDRRVISVGGGAPCRKASRDAFAKKGFVVWLDASPDKILARLRREPDGLRPLLSGPALSLRAVSDLLKKRRPHYRQAQLRVAVDRLTPSGAARRILRSISAP